MAQFKIINALGQELFSWQHFDTQQTLDLGRLSLSSGLYFIQVYWPNGEMMKQKFIYQKQ